MNNVKYNIIVNIESKANVLVVVYLSLKWQLAVDCVVLHIARLNTLFTCMHTCIYTRVHAHIHHSDINIHT